jgi:hypothetical protein
MSQERATSSAASSQRGGRWVVPWDHFGTTRYACGWATCMSPHLALDSGISAEQAKRLVPRPGGSSGLRAAADAATLPPSLGLSSPSVARDRS